MASACEIGCRVMMMKRELGNTAWRYPVLVMLFGVFSTRYLLERSRVWAPGTPQPSGDLVPRLNVTVGQVSTSVQCPASHPSDFIVQGKHVLEELALTHVCARAGQPCRAFTARNRVGEIRRSTAVHTAYEYELVIAQRCSTHQLISNTAPSGRRDDDHDERLRCHRTVSTTREQGGGCRHRLARPSMIATCLG